MRIALLVSGHGLGHAARACAVVEALSQLQTGWHLAVCSDVPARFFEESLSFDFEYHDIICDVGFVQKNPFEIDGAATLDRLESFYSDDSPFFRDALNRVSALSPDVVLCDISPLGLWIAQSLSIPSILIENFLWEDLYRTHSSSHCRFEAFAHRLERFTSLADLHISAAPAVRIPGDSQIHRVPPISRAVRRDRRSVRSALGVLAEETLVFFSGGSWCPELIKEVQILSGNRVVASSGSSLLEVVTCSDKGSAVYIERGRSWYHPDLMSACDVVLGKLGYSTLAEAYAVAAPFAYIARNACGEAETLRKYAKKHLVSSEIDRDTGPEDLCAVINRLSACPRASREATNGAAEAAELILNFLYEVIPHG